MCFVEYFEKFIDFNIDQTKLVKIILTEKGYTLKACQTRVFKARQIINNGLSCKALKMIMNAKKVDEETKSKAIVLYNKKCI